MAIKGVETKKTKKKDYIREVSSLTKIPMTTVEDVLNAFVDVCTKEMVVNGEMKYPGLPTVRTVTAKNINRYQKDMDITLRYDEIQYLKARIPVLVKQLFREKQRDEIAKKHNLPRDKWYEKNIFCKGDWRKASK